MKFSGSRLTSRYWYNLVLRIPQLGFLKKVAATAAERRGAEAGKRVGKDESAVAKATADEWDGWDGKTNGCPGNRLGQPTLHEGALPALSERGYNGG